MEYKWKALGIVNIGSLMGSIDATVLLIAFPQVARQLGASLLEMVWVLMIYIVMGTALVLSLGRVADLKGRKRLYSAGFVVFVAGSGLCGLSDTGLELVLFRAVQGVGGAMLIANSFAIVSDAFPPAERGRAFGVNTIVWGAGAIFGVILGGLILSVASWRWIFWINVPIGVLATLAGVLVLRESVTPNPRETFDLPAAILFTGGLVALLFGVTEAILTSYGDPLAGVPLAVGAVLLAGFALWESRISADPILPFGLFRRWIFSASLAASVLQGLALFATNFVLMVYFQGIRGVPVLTASYLLVPLFLTLGVFGPIGGRLSDRYGARVVSTVGLLIQGGVLVLLSGISASTPLSQVAVYEALLGVGGGLFFPANTAAIMASVPRARFGVASGVMMTFRNSSMALSFTVAVLVLTASLPAGVAVSLFGGSFTPLQLARLGVSSGALSGAFVDGMRAAFRLAAGFVFAGALFSALRGRESRVEAEVYVHRPTTPRPTVLRAFPRGPSNGPASRLDPRNPRS